MLISNEWLTVEATMCKQSARKIGPTRRSVSGFFSFRPGHSVWFESMLERDFLVLRAFDPRVRNVLEQPCQISFVGRNGQAYRYTPDFLVEFEPWVDARPHLVEVKPEAEWRKHWRTWLPKWKAAYRFARDRGWEFHIADESRIRTTTLANIRRLERFGRMQFPASESDALILAVGETCTKVKDLLERQACGHDPARAFAHVWHLIARQRLQCDIENLLGPETLVWIHQQPREWP